MDKNRPCGCKGRRSCLICEVEYQISPQLFISLEKKERSYVYCCLCERAWPGWDYDPVKFHPNHNGKSIPYPGVYIQPDFLSETEKQELMDGINNEVWDSSQSGRRKQNYGPKCNFKKNKIQAGDFIGFPQFSKFVQDKFNTFDILKDFHVIEQCSLEYDPLRGASIDPHIDDCWIWGERVVTVNVQGDTFLTMTKFKGDNNKYNLNQVGSYPPVLDSLGKPLDLSNANNTSNTSNTPSMQTERCDDDVIVRIFMPEKSLIILYGPARYEWEHSVLREDIISKRICLAYREFTPPYLPGGIKQSIGAEVLHLSKKFWSRNSSTI